MHSAVANIAINCADAYRLAAFWSQVTGRPIDPEDRPGDDEIDVLLLPDGPMLHFNEVPDPERGKNGIHLCLRPDTTREQEVERLLGIGATLVADRRKPGGHGWVVLADPEGNEFCVLTSPDERAALTAP
ncbi:Glyoxalase-like domain protein [Streptomyces sp. YIM 130001]|uniref:VOC family protein n=1 Tax=Streptomyces sp. YIM 130001 TaxID=2259644 RepID=UPI000E655127|nr:VOC family protein [Streptomyces sp. YIM 130001]RII15879.1 Glyoxalase-like domain protein [Streptomyces sp. YIM 130001]